MALYSTQLGISQENPQMLRKTLAILMCTAFSLSLDAQPHTSPTASTLSAAQIVDKNVATRGGLQAWRAVEALTLTGKMGVGGNRRAALSVPMPEKRKGDMSLQGVQRPVEEVQLPFVMDLARPHKQRFELVFNGQTAIQVYDGTHGWKLRPFLNRRDVEPFTSEEMKIASSQDDIGGPLVDYQAKNSTIELVGTEQVDGRSTYKVKVTTKDGNSKHVWIDTQTFLETKIEGQPRRLDATNHPVEVYFRDYRQVSGLMIPFVLETHVLPVTKTATGLRDTPVPVEKITVEKVVVNPKFDASVFAKPEATVAQKTK
jgi:outer membrane lipoprotein-sorting protein